jgi:Domain of unknown function (DUF6460)
MDRRQFFGESVTGTIVRLVLLSIVVGIVFKALGVTPETLIQDLVRILQRIYDLGFNLIGRAFSYFLLGAVVVIPIWFIVRLLSRPRDSGV